MNLKSAETGQSKKMFEFKILHLCVACTSPVGDLTLSDSLSLKGSVGENVGPLAW